MEERTAFDRCAGGVASHAKAELLAVR
eukprot:COSAG02_NODE_37866_length_436_cov_1.118694_1_plen_26_part_01